MGDMLVGVANIDDKGFYGLMEDTPVKAVASLNPSLQVSVSFGRFENDSLSWEKFSAFSPNKYLEEVGKCATPGSVAQKKAYFEAHYKKIAERKAEIMDQEKQMDKNASFRSIISSQGSVDSENCRLVGESVVNDGSHGKLTCDENKHVTDIAAEVNELSIDELDEETIIVKEYQSLVDQVKEEVKEGLDSPKPENSEEIAHVEEKPEVVVQLLEKPKEILEVEDVEDNEVREVREEILSNDTTGDTSETPIKEIIKEKSQKLPKKDGNVGIKSKRIYPKPKQVTRKPETKRFVTSKKTPPSKEIGSIIKETKKPAPSISKAPPVFSTPRMYKPAPQNTSLSTSHSYLKRENPSSLPRKKQPVLKSLHISMNLDPSASDPTAITSTRKSLIMERMGDKDIVKRAFKTFQKSFDLKTSVDEQNTAIKQNPTKATSIPSIASRQKENGRRSPTKASSMEKSIGTSTYRSPSHGLKSNVTSDKSQKELSKAGAKPVEKTPLQKNPKAGVTDAKARKDSLTPKAKPMQGSLPVRTNPKRLLGKVL